MAAIRFGLIGAGGIAEYTARELAGHPDAAIVAVADPSEPRARALADRFGVPAVLAHHEALLVRDDVDAVYVAVPNSLHAPLACAALEHGKHVLLEKPFAMNATEATAVAAAAERNDRVLMLGMNQRFDPAVQRARALVEQGSLGAVYHTRAFWRRRAGIPRIGSWFTSRAAAGGGALLDIGVHMLDATLHILGEFEPASVTGAAFTRFGNRGLGDGSWGRSERSFDTFDVDDFATALIRMKSGAVVSLDAAWALHQEAMEERGIELYGEDAGLSVFGNRLYQRDADRSFVTRQGLPAGPLAFPHASRVHHFVNVLLGREAPVVTVAQSLAVQRILDAIYTSARTGAEVRL
ncbi:MAG: Gfo/Idh/MocA family oxidoreductase [Pseudomonadales bacterium]|nr:Gfo/Idh/MocA family oxidoreductase [Pseudomonadales bacterium]